MKGSGAPPLALFDFADRLFPFQQEDERFLSDAYRDSMVAALIISIV